MNVQECLWLANVGTYTGGIVMSDFTAFSIKPNLRVLMINTYPKRALPFSYPYGIVPILFRTLFALIVPRAAPGRALFVSARETAKQAAKQWHIIYHKKDNFMQITNMS